DMLVSTCPGSMHDVAFARTIEPCTMWIRTRESGISLVRWRRQGHNSPPLARNGLKDTGATPVSPRYYSPGLPPFTSHEEDDPLLEAIETLRQLNTVNQRKLPDDISLDFVPDRWRRFVQNHGEPSRRAYELCALSTLRDGLNIE